MSEHHHHESDGEMPFEQKLLKVLEHWVKHNEDHAVTYRNWAEKAKAKDMSEVADLLNEAAHRSVQVNETFNQALAIVSVQRKQYL
jgi:rubrerythrin